VAATKRTGRYTTDGLACLLSYFKVRIIAAFDLESTVA